MLDLKYIIAHVDAVRQNCVNRNMPPDVIEDFDKAIELEGQRKELLAEVETIRRRQNEVAQATGSEKDPEARAVLIEEGKALKATVADSEEALKRLEDELWARMVRIPNLTHPDAPIGQTEDDNREIRRVGQPPAFDFEPQDHVELGKSLDLIDFEAGAKVSGHGFYFLRNDAVLLDLALQSYALKTLIAPRVHARSSRRTWPATRSWKASASRLAGPRPRSTPSRIRTCA